MIWIKFSYNTENHKHFIFFVSNFIKSSKTENFWIIIFTNFLKNYKILLHFDNYLTYNHFLINSKSTPIYIYLFNAIDIFETISIACAKTYNVYFYQKGKNLYKKLTYIFNERLIKQKLVTKYSKTKTYKLNIKLFISTSDLIFNNG